MNAFFINTDTKEWPIYEGDLRLRFPNTSLPPEITTPPEPYAWVVDTEIPSFDLITQSVIETAPVNKDGIWSRVWEVVDLSEEQIEHNHNMMRQQVKSQAESLLLNTDWTQKSDASDPTNPPYLTNADEYKAYRAQLRAIAIDPPITVEQWPVKPDSIWST